MYKNKHYRRRRRSFSTIRTLIMSIAMALTVFSVIGGSIAWLMTQTTPLVNTFTYGDISILLEETTGNSYKMTPGATLAKDPMLTVEAGSEDCWLFIKIDESSNASLSDYIAYEVADDWTALSGVPGVYYREVDSAATDQTYSVLKDDQVTVKDTVTKEMLEALTSATNPTLTFTGYAVQRDANIDAIDTVDEAWALIDTN